MDRNRIDMILLISTLCLVGIGCVMVYSASFVVAEDKFYGESSFFLKRHLVRVGLGIMLLLFFAHFDYRNLRKISLFLFGVALLCLLLVFIPGLGLTIRGATRTVKLWILNFQPAEYMKFALIIFLAHWMERKSQIIQNLTAGLLPMLVVTGLVCALIALQPDFGTAIALAVSVGALLYIGGARLVHLAMTAAVAIPVVGLKLYMSPHSRIRMATYMKRLFGDGDQFAMFQGADYQLQQSLISLGSGGFFGTGLGESRQKYLFLPDPHTDFVFAVIGEELGFVGAATVLILFSIMAWRGVRVARNAPEMFGCYLAAGLTILIAVHVMINVGVVTGLLPTTGLPLPFLSYGGSWLLFCMASIGIILNISRGHARRQRTRYV